ncbi:TonB-dependent receptor plug domain-containing protein [Sphingomonas quercus]|uniref:TonB-dependent receptor n=1 Tax=Sphingomonas quercus TaxID=2842451 RepID=A0ABS6BEB9_9SPHN|nr:TonB-dependent receptor [Sphingomonas quercus]MBU3076658.1 TonB-dependent receptor [Sphingomonas quercus]
MNFTLALLAGSSLVGLAAPAMAQEPVAAPAAAAAPAAPAEGEIVVTGSRITSSSFAAPTPTQMVDAAQLQANAQPNIFTTIAQLPSLLGSTGATVGNNSTSSGTQGLSSFALHGLGTIRTLTLLDGQRVVGANVTGVPDISLFPQILVERVDVVTGGASASYGSDAVGGVVNFVTQKHFEGVKGNFQTGISTYGDNAQGTAQVALGKAFMDGRLHVVVSGEYDYEEGVGAGGYGEAAPAGRDWYRTSTLFDTGSTAAGGGPQYIRGDHAQAYQYSKYGLITAGPLQGTAIGADGKPFTFVYGGNANGVQGVPAKNAAGTVNNCYNGFCMGGDLSGNVGIGTTLQASIKRWNTYSRVGFDITPDTELYVTANVAKISTQTQPNPGAAKSGLIIQCANPFVPDLVQQACAANGISQFQYGLSNAILPNITVNPTRQQYRFVGGLTGKASLFGTDWRYDTYYEHGESITDIRVDNITLNNRYNNAIQATVLNGQIVCSNATARANGCVPLNIFGNVAPSAATLNYIEPGAGPFQHTRQTQDVASFNVSGEPAQLWAGPLSVATGVEWRREWYKVTGDPYSNGNGAANGDLASLYPVDPTLNAAGNNWYAGNYRSGGGSYHVLEGFLELNLPVIDSEALGRANLNGGIRVTDYSTSGTTYAWKIGGTWDTPIDGIKLRAVTSRDVRAPNLSELFAAGSSVNTPNFNNPFGAPVNILQITSGNPALKPEVGRNTTAGIVLSRPSWAPGLNLSVDWYKVKVSGVIASLSPTQVVNFCFDGTLANCKNLSNAYFDLSHADGVGNFVNTQPFNFAKLLAEGLDIEATYQFVNPLGLDGRLTLRALATHVIHNTQDSGIPGSIPIDSAGVNSGATPNWKLLGMQTWATDKWRFTLQERWFSDGVYNSTYIVCQTNCPVSTSNNRTIDNNTMKGAFYVDVSGSYSITKSIEAYFKVDNLFNRDPEPSPATNTGIDLNPQLYDVLGRMFRLGVRVNF